PDPPLPPQLWSNPPETAGHTFPRAGQWLAVRSYRKSPLYSVGPCSPWENRGLFDFSILQFSSSVHTCHKTPLEESKMSPSSWATASRKAWAAALNMASIM